MATATEVIEPLAVNRRSGCSQSGGDARIKGEGDARGKAAVFEKLQKIGKLTDGTARLELVGVHAAGDELASCTLDVRPSPRG